MQAGYPAAGQDSPRILPGIFDGTLRENVPDAWPDDVIQPWHGEFPEKMDIFFPWGKGDGQRGTEVYGQAVRVPVIGPNGM